MFDNKVDFILFGNFGSAQRKSFDSDLNFGSAQRKSFLCVWFREGAATAGMCLRRKEKLRKKIMWKAYLTIEQEENIENLQIYTDGAKRPETEETGFGGAIPG